MKFLSALTDRLKQSLERSQEVLSAALDTVLSAGRSVDEALLQELEELLISADLGAQLAGEFVALVREEARRGRVSWGSTGVARPPRAASWRRLSRPRGSRSCWRRPIRSARRPSTSSRSGEDGAAWR